MSDIEDIDAQIAALQAKKRELAKKARPAKIKKVKVDKPTKHRRQVTCSNYGLIAKKTEMQQVAKYEYQHLVCPVEPRIVRVEFTIGQ